MKDFDEKFAQILHIHRGECVIVDSTGIKWQVHVENGLVTQIGGLESIKDFITTFAEKIRESVVEEVLEIVEKERETWARESIGEKAVVSVRTAIANLKDK